MTQIIPMKDMRDTTKISNMAHASDEPIYITKNGYGDLVVLSIENYESIMARQNVYDKIMKGVRQADNGELLDGDEVLTSLKSKYGAKL